MTTKLASLRSMMILASLALAACAGDDDDSDTNASATISTTIGSASNNSASATDDPTNASDTTDDPTDATVDPSAGTEDPGETTDTPADTGEECTAQDECIDDSMCAGGGMCIGCICIGGDDTAPAECGTNVGTMNPACDECMHTNCCPEVQACFGDETVTEATPCLNLNNCVATSCTTAMTIEDLTMCIDANCPELAGELETFLMFNSCGAMNCAAACGG